MMTNHSPIRTSRVATLHKLAFTTALAGSLALIPGAALAQNNTPANPGTITVGPGGSAPVFTGPTNGSSTNMTVDLRAQSTVIEWQRFNVAEGSSVRFGTGLAGDVAVLNRVTTTNMSNIRGALNSDANISVFLVNPNGIMVHSTGTVSTGSFVASTLDIRDVDFHANRYVFFDDYGGSRDGKGLIDIAGGRITTRGTGIGLILLGREIASTGTLDSGTQATALVAADDVTLNYTAGSPLGIQITQGTDVSDAMRIVSGSIQGRDVHFAMATKSSATNSLLQIDGNVRAVGGDKGIVIVGGRSVVDPNVVVSTAGGDNTSGRVDLRTGGTLAYGGSTQGGVRIGATGAATVAGAVTSSGEYSVRGTSVTLGAANATVLQQANRAVLITATDGDITGPGSLTLAADIDGTVGDDTDSDGVIDRSHAMTIRGANIDFGTGTTLQSGGAGLVSAVNIFSDTRNGNVALGTVFASTLDGGIDGGALEGGLMRGGTSTVNTGTVVLSGSANLQAGTLTLGSLSAAGSVTLNASSLRAGSVTSNGAGVTVDAGTFAGRTTGTRANVAAASAIDIDVAGAALLGTVNAGAATVIEAGAIDASSVTSGGLATITSRNGNIALGGLTVFSGGAVIDADDSLTINGPVGIIGDYRASGDDITLGGTQQATGAVTMTAPLGQIGNVGTLTLTANSDGVGTEELKLTGRANLGASSTLNGGSARQSNVVIDTLVTNAVTLGNVNAAALTIAGGLTLARDLTLGDVVTTADLALASTQAVRAGGLRSTAGLVDVRGITIDVGAVRAANSATLAGRQVDFASVDAAGATLSTSGAGGTRRLSGTSVTTSGTATLTSDGGAISIGTVTTGGLSVTSAGNVSLDSVAVTGNAAITTTGSADIALADGLTATGAVSITAADDIAASSITSTGGALTITAGGDVTGVNGARATLGAAGNLVLNAAGDVRLSTVTGNSVTLRSGTIDATTIAGAAGIDLSSLAGDLAIEGLSTTGGNATLNAFGAASIDGPVAVVGGYSVSGNGVTLGGTQGATGAVDVTARGGSIGTTAGLQLTANSDGVGTEALTLHGRANLGVDSLLRGGADRQSQVVIDASANTNIRLGNVDASSLAIAGGAALGGSLTFGNVVTSDTVSLTVNGGIVAGGLTSLNGSVTLGGNGGATIGTVSGAAIAVAMRGNVDVTSFTASNGDARFGSTTGTVALGGGTTTGSLTAEGGLVSIANAITAGSDISLAATAGNLVLASDLTATNMLSLAASGAIDQISGRVAAASLTGSSGGATTLRVVGNAIAGLDAFSANGLWLATSGALTVTGAVDGGQGGTTLQAFGNLAIAPSGSIAGAEAVLSTNADFLNRSGADAVTAGRWTIYAAAPDTSSFDGLDSRNTAIWNGSYATRAPGTMSGNRYVFAYQPTLTFTSTDGSKVYGTDLSGGALGFHTVSGYHPGVANAFRSDTAGTAYSGAPVITSAGFAERAGVAGGPYGVSIAAGSLASDAGYAFRFVDAGSIDVTAKALSATVTANSKTYDGTTAASGGISLDGVLAGDNVGSSVTVAFTDKNAGTGKTVLISGGSLTGADAGNYTVLLPASVLADIYQKALSATVTANGKTYDGTTAATGSVGLDGVLAGDSVDSSVTLVFTDKNAGTGKTVLVSGGSLSGADAGNYTLALSASVLADIYQKALSATVTANGKTYDGTTAASGSVDLDGIVAGDSVTGSAIFAFADKNAGTGKAVLVSGGGLTGADAGNYTLQLPASALADIYRKAVTVSVAADSKVYDGSTTGSGSVLLGGVVAGDSVATTAGVFTFADKNAGTGKTVSVTGLALTGADAGNYAMTLPTNVVAGILRREVMVTADDLSRPMGRPDPALTYSVTSGSLAPGDALTGALVRAPGEGRGSYAIGQGTLSASPNYVLSFRPGLFVIEPAWEASQLLQPIRLPSFEKFSQIGTPLVIDPMLFCREPARCQ